MNESASQILSLLEAGEIQQLEVCLRKVEAIDNDLLGVMARAVSKSNCASPGHSWDREPNVRAARMFIEFLLQRKEASKLVMLGCLTWRKDTPSHVSERCLDAAVATGDYLQAYSDAWEVLSKPLASDQGRHARTPAAMLIVKLAKAGFELAFFDAGELLRDGTDVTQNLESAFVWFWRCTIAGTRHVEHLKDLRFGDAFEEIAKLSPKIHPPEKARLWQVMGLCQSEAARAAEKRLSVLLPGDEIKALVEGSEVDGVEFKELAVWDEENMRDVAAFLNAKGGIIFIGIDKHGAVRGIEPSLQAVRVHNTERFAAHTYDKLGAMGKDLCAFITIVFQEFEGRTICRIQISASTRPVFLREKNGEENFYVRRHASKTKLNSRETSDYIQTHWPKFDATS
jgi:hypothetical protein